MVNKEQLHATYWDADDQGKRSFEEEKFPVWGGSSPEPTGYSTKMPSHGTISRPLFPTLLLKAEAALSKYLITPKVVTSLISGIKTGVNWAPGNCLSLLRLRLSQVAVS